MKLFFTASLLIISTFSFSQINFGLVAYYPLDGNILDKSGNNFNGNGIKSFISGNDRNSNQGCAIKTGGGENDSIVIPYNSAFNSKKYTISVWVNFEDWFNQGPIKLFGRSNNDKNGLHLTVQNWINFRGIYLSYPNISVPFSKWNHIACTQEDSIYSVYFNNVLIKTGKTSPVVFSQSDIVLGSFLYGTIDDVRYYNRALSSSEITELYNLPSSCVTTSISEDQITATENKKVVFTSDILGKEINDPSTFSGIMIVYYSDGSRKKIMNTTK